MLVHSFCVIAETVSLLACNILAVLIGVWREQMPVRNAVQILIVVAVYMYLVFLLGNNVMCSLTYPCLSSNGRLLVIISSGNHISVIQTGTYHDIIAKNTYTLMIMFICVMIIFKVDVTFLLPDFSYSNLALFSVPTCCTLNSAAC